MAKNIIISVMTLYLMLGVSPQVTKATETLVIATGTTGGTYDIVGKAIGALINIKLAEPHKITVRATYSTGSGENVQMLKYKGAQLAILQSVFGLNAYNGRGPYEDKSLPDLRSISMLWENVEHFIVLQKYAQTGTMDDLKNFGKKFSIGKRGSGSESSGRTILAALGIDPEKEMILEFMAYRPSAQAMMSGRIFGMNTPAGPPVPAVTKLFAELGAGKIRVLDFTDTQLAQIQKQYQIWNRFIIKAGTYPNQIEDINTISQPNFLAVHKDVPEETIYLITKTVYENLPFLNKAHIATEAMSLERAANGLPVPLHPGAAKYYKEMGIAIPDEIVP